MTRAHIQHLFWRAGFGIGPEELPVYLKWNRQNLIDNLFNEAKPVHPLTVSTKDLDHYTGELYIRDKANRRDFNQKSRAYIIDLNTAWIFRMMNTKAVLQERMTLFWTNHFVCKDHQIYHVQRYHNTIRKHALGNFRTFVKAVSKEAAMLKYLNNKQNRKQKPNENFARELMELFTLGEGHYTETDIKESARAFTGYAHRFDGEFFLKRIHHDYDFKSFFGHRGRFDGDAIIDLILEEKQCARFICQKIYTYFVNPVPNAKHIEAMTNYFYRDYDIEALMRFVFMSDWFYDPVNIGAKIKSPVDLLVGMARTVPVKFNNKRDLLKLQTILGQTLFNPPNVAGWAGDKTWIDANTIMIRLKLPSLVLNNAIISIKEQGDFTDKFRERYFKNLKNRLPFKTNPYWETFMSNYNSVPTEALFTWILQCEMNKGTADYLKMLNKKSKRDFCIQLMSLPEYQMC